jgi:hypothetical protein
MCDSVTHIYKLCDILPKMKIFTRKIRKKHIEQFAFKIAELLESELPHLKEVINFSKIYGISFTFNPRGIYISRGYSPKNFEDINRKHKINFNLTGISVFNRKEKLFKPIKLYYQSNGLTKIEVDEPEYLHKIFDLNKIQKESIELEFIKVENPDRKIVEEALKSLSKKQIQLLELDYTFEIEFDEKSYYTILDMEDGNYVAVDKVGKIYRLNHDHKQRVKLLAENANVFFELYNGDKDELEKIMSR